MGNSKTRVTIDNIILESVVVDSAAEYGAEPAKSELLNTATTDSFPRMDITTAASIAITCEKLEDLFSIEWRNYVDHSWMPQNIRRHRIH